MGYQFEWRDKRLSDCSDPVPPLVREQSGATAPERENDMAKVKVTLNLKQEDLSDGFQSFKYLVVKATNTIDLKVNDYLSEKEVKSLVRDGVTVNIPADADD